MCLVGLSTSRVAMSKVWLQLSSTSRQLSPEYFLTSSAGILVGTLSLSLSLYLSRGAGVCSRLGSERPGPGRQREYPTAPSFESRGRPLGLPREEREELRGGAPGLRNGGNVSPGGPMPARRRPGPAGEGRRRMGGPLGPQGGPRTGASLRRGQQKGKGYLGRGGRLPATERATAAEGGACRWRRKGEGRHRLALQGPSMGGMA